MKKSNFVFLASYYTAIENLERAEALETLYAIVKYGVTGTIPKKMTNLTKSILDLVKPTINSSYNRYQACIENGKKGGAPRGNQNAKKTTKQPKTIKVVNLETTEKQPNGLNLKTTQNNLDKDIDKDIDNIKESNKEKYFDSLLAGISNITLKTCLEEFINLRNKMKKPLTAYGLELTMKKLHEMATTDDERIKIVNQSISKGWLDLYPIDKDSTQKQDSSFIHNNYIKEQIDTFITRDLDNVEI